MVRRSGARIAMVCCMALGLASSTAHAAQTTLQVCVIHTPEDTCDWSEPAPPAPTSSGGAYSATPPLAFEPALGELYVHGTASPSARVTLLRGAQQAASTLADASGSFSFDVAQLAPGTYTFSVWAEDSRGLRSYAPSFTLGVAPGVGTVVSRLMLPPTIEVSEAALRVGDAALFGGQTVPGAVLTLAIAGPDPRNVHVSADNKGVWTYRHTFSRAGTYAASAHARTEHAESGESLPLLITVASPPPPAARLACAVPGDINCDLRIDLADFSLLTYWLGRPFAPGARKADLNKDGRVDLKDFSLLAYYWTG